MKSGEFILSHPKTRAERRAIRRQVIKRNIELGHRLIWFTGICYCEPRRLFLNPGRSWPCWVHRNRAFWREVNQYAKTGPCNHYRLDEPDWFMQGILRRDYRAGGGRRASTHQTDWGGGLHGAGRFSLAKALEEYE